MKTRVDEPEGFMTMVFPQARAGPIFQAIIKMGKFQGMIWKKRSRMNQLRGHGHSFRCCR
jgi:hypothetical protein